MQKSIQGSLFALTVVLALAPVADAAKFKADEPPKLSVSGKIKDPHGQPVKGAQVVLFDKETHERFTAKTDRDGMFEIAHARGGTESLQVIPPPKSGLAQAVLNEIRGDEGRHVLLSLKPGLWITGRVVSSDVPLKGVRVKVIGRGHDVVHDSGEAQTNGRGEYALSVTPGEKLFEVSEVRDNAVVGLHRLKHHVTAGGALPDISVPGNKTAGVE